MEDTLSDLATPTSPEQPLSPQSSRSGENTISSHRNESPLSTGNPENGDTGYEVYRRNQVGTPNSSRSDDSETYPNQENMDVDDTTNESDTERDDNVLGERVLNQNLITDEEKTANAEFFCGKAAKTPERYMRIRNYILNAWINSKPGYVTKTSVRPGLKDCGDVNAIGRVHQYLEDIGAINVGAASPSVKHKKTVKRKARVVEYVSDTSSRGKDDDEWYKGRSRKRRVRSTNGEWVYERDLGGHVISHDPSSVDVSGGRRMRRRNRVNYNENYGTNDPFRLVPPQKHTDNNPPPFRVTASSNAMLVMDFHAHLVSTEIIGLLGGKYNHDEGFLQVSMAFPCQSFSTGFQCEMDPSSELEARDAFAAKNLDVIGWYHSHPTFDPQPSIRDIENQAMYQELCRHESGIEPFIGIIVTPFDRRDPSNISKFEFLSIGNDYEPLGTYRIPYICQRQVIQDTNLSEELYTQLEGLIREYQDNHDRVNMWDIYRNDPETSRLDKFLQSISSHIFTDADQSTAFINRLREMIERDFKPSLSKTHEEGDVKPQVNVDGELVSNENEGRKVVPDDRVVLGSPAEFKEDIVCNERNLNYGGAIVCPVKEEVIVESN
ncbi:8453_t:CDS:10 [Paraglomus brasilianum]|uniref:8453_t:CDS:1 n=1 Tax=Paraglomus brasilianum TaxID=144538 RepID=A0A9N9D553_9GLOM|nr:8453_t:CDS:10 [Paraglomus brasilianum]